MAIIILVSNGATRTEKSVRLFLFYKWVCKSHGNGADVIFAHPLTAAQPQSENSFGRSGKNVRLFSFTVNG